MTSLDPMPTADSAPDSTTSLLTVITFWLLVALPLAWGVYHTAVQAAQLFR